MYRWQASELRGHHHEDRATGGHPQHDPAHHATSTAHIAFQPSPAATSVSASSSSSALDALPATRTSSATAADADRHDQQPQQQPPSTPLPHTSLSKSPPTPSSSQHARISHDNHPVVDAVVDIQPPADSGTDQAKSGLSSGLSSIELPPAAPAMHSGISSQASAPPGAHNPHHRRSLLRLSLLMGITMVRHPLPALQPQPQHPALCLCQQLDTCVAHWTLQFSIQRTPMHLRLLVLILPKH